MHKFVEEVKPIDDCLRLVSDALDFPWALEEKKLSLMNAAGFRASRDVIAGESSPPFDRSLRDGYAVSSSSTAGASSGSPVFLKIRGDISMGETPDFVVGGEEAASIPTGAMMPEGADAVVMLEDAETSGGWLEVRKAVSRGENIAISGEETRQGDVLIHMGDEIDQSRAGMLASFGVSEIGVADPRIGVISTGDEIVPVETSLLPAGMIRDANTYIISSLVSRYGFRTRSYGIVRDSWDELKSASERASGECDVVLLSGGSSVGARDHTAKIVESFSNPGLLVRGINMTPGKPTIIGGSKREKKFIAGLPGHPLSCAVAMIFVVMPMLLRMTGARRDHVGRYLRMPLASDVHGRTGPDEFIPARIEDGAVFPLAAKSGYVSALADADGFIRMRPDVETLRKGERAEIWIW